MKISKTKTLTLVKISTLSAVVMAISASVSAGQAHTFSVVHGSPDSHVIAKYGVAPWMSCVSEAVGDDVKFNYFPGGQISGTPELFNALESKVADLTPLPVGYVSAEMPLNGVSMLPGLGSSSVEIVEGYSKAMKTGTLADEYASRNVKPLFAMAYPPYQVISNGDRVNNIQDFGGKVFRSAGGAMNLALNELGASPAEISIGDTYIAMERGTVDGTISAFASVKPFSLQELATSMSRNGSFGTFSNVYSMRLDDFNALPENLQDVFTNCGTQTGLAMAQELDNQVALLAQEFTDLGIDVYDIGSEELAVINESLAKVQADWVNRLARRGLPAETALNEYKQALGSE